MQTLWLDIRYALRAFKRQPGFTAVAVIAIALGISANTTIFSSADALILHPYSFPHQDRLVMLHERNLAVGIRRGSVSPGNFSEWRKRNHTLEEMVAMTNRELDFSLGDKPERYNGYSVTANFFETLGGRAAMGRTFTRDEDQPGREAVVVLKHDFWQKRFGGDPNIVGKTVSINRKPHTVIGVMPEKFDFPYGGCQMYVPKVIAPEDERDFGNHYLNVMGLLKPGVPPAQADADFRPIAAALAAEYPDANSGRTAFLNSVTADYTRGARTFLPILIAAVIFVLLIACANVANLQLVRAASRQKEMAVRLALGASRWRIVRQLLTESVLIALAGGALGLALAAWGIEALAKGIPQAMSRYIPGWNQLGINQTVLLFTLLVSVLAGVLFGLAPAWQATKADLNETLKEGGGKGSVGGRNRLRSVLVVAEIALSLVLLVGAGLMVRSFIQVMRTDFGLDPDNVISLGITLSDEKYQPVEARRNFMRQLLQDVEAMPNVARVGAVNNLPMSGYGSSSNFQIMGQPPVPKEKEPRADVRVATDGYFNAVGTTLRRGRMFNEQDTAEAPPVVLINEALAARFLPGRDAVGQRLAIGGGPPMEIAGVVANVMNDDIDDPAEPGLYLPYSQSKRERGFMLVIRGASDPAPLVGAVRERIAALDPNLAVSDIKTLQQAIDERMSPKRMMMWMMGIFGLMALAMAAVGTYAVMAYSVAQRTHEIGVRIALGAQGRDVIRLVVKQGLLLTLAGVAIGLAGAFAMARAMAEVLYGVTATDPLTFIGITALLIAVAMIACLAPARRATKVDPMVALRYE